MPELPEVQTTVNGLRKIVIGLRIDDAWSDYNSPYFKGSGTIKDPLYFKHFKKAVLGKRIISIDRRAKNVLINLSGGLTVLVHMKMTGHLLFGNYSFDPSNKKDPWQPLEPESLKDPFNRRVHFMLMFNNKKNLALSDTRKFAKVTLIEMNENHLSQRAGRLAVNPKHPTSQSEHVLQSEHLKNLGPEPLEKGFTFKRFVEQLNLRPHGRIKQVLMDQAIIAGIGNIYADESLWRTGIHPLERVENIPQTKLKGLFIAIKKTLSRGIDLGGDSMSDYRNIHGEKGRFQEQHHAYQRTGEHCRKRGCNGTIRRIMVGQRSAHYCDKHQRLT
jgi:formamidopyrimidine-DNA glycosylase